MNVNERKKKSLSVLKDLSFADVCFVSEENQGAGRASVKFLQDERILLTRSWAAWGFQADDEAHAMEVDKLPIFLDVLVAFNARAVRCVSGL